MAELIPISGTTLTATYEIVTPMFLGDADSNTSAGTIRPSAVKGALAFWWRTFRLPQLVAEHNDKAKALKSLQTEEQTLFGTSGQQSKFLLSVASLTKANVVKKSNEFKSAQDGGLYLGYGVVDAFGSKKKNIDPKKLTADLIKEGHIFTVKLQLRKSVTADMQNALIAALKLLGLLGGLGKRVRRGYGALSLQHLAVNDEAHPLPSSVSDYTEALSAITHHATEGSNLPITSFSKDSLLYYSPNAYPTAMDALNALGAAFVRYRGWGKGQKFGQIIVDRTFKKDHDLFTKKERLGQYTPMRSAFGLPINYSKVFTIAPQDHERRASPAFFHIQKLEDRFHIVVSVFKNQFLPSKTLKTKNKTADFDFEKNFHIITDFLEDIRHDDTPTNSKKRTQDHLNLTKILPTCTEGSAQ